MNFATNHGRGWVELEVAVLADRGGGREAARHAPSLAVRLADGLKWQLRPCNEFEA